MLMPARVFFQPAEKQGRQTVKATEGCNVNSCAAMCDQLAWPRQRRSSLLGRRSGRPACPSVSGCAAGSVRRSASPVLPLSASRRPGARGLGGRAPPQLRHLYFPSRTIVAVATLTVNVKLEGLSTLGRHAMSRTFWRRPHNMRQYGLLPLSRNLASLLGSNATRLYQTNCTTCCSGGAGGLCSTFSPDGGSYTALCRLHRAWYDCWDAHRAWVLRLQHNRTKTVHTVTCQQHRIRPSTGEHNLRQRAAGSKSEKLNLTAYRRISRAVTVADSPRLAASTLASAACSLLADRFDEARDENLTTTACTTKVRHAGC